MAFALLSAELVVDAPARSRGKPALTPWLPAGPDGWRRVRPVRPGPPARLPWSRTGGVMSRMAAKCLVRARPSAVGPRKGHAGPMGVPSVRLPADRRVAWADVAGKARPPTARFACGTHVAAIAWPGSQPGGRPLPPPGL